MNRANFGSTLAIAFIALGLVLRLAFAAANAFWLRLPHQDAFHRVAAEIAAGLPASRSSLAFAYSKVLGFIYSVTGPHEIVGYAASALAWTGAALALNAMLRILGAAPIARLAALLIFALTPSSIWFGSVIMRDVYQLLFVNLMIVGALRIGVERDYDAAVPMVLAGAALAFLHNGLVPWTILVGWTVLGWVLVLHRPRVLRQALVALLVLALTVFSAAMFTRYGYDIAGGVSAASSDYRESVVRAMQPRTEFQLFGDLAGSGGLVGVFVGLLQYMLEPLPWQVRGLGDLGVMAENWLRLLFIGMALWALVTDRTRRAPLLFLLFAYCCLEGIWSLGTAAWGTAIRHHLPASGILLAAAFASITWRRRGNHIGAAA